jgi:hypothetical protein
MGKVSGEDGAESVGVSLGLGQVRIVLDGPGSLLVGRDPLCVLVLAIVLVGATFAALGVIVVAEALSF